MGGASAVSSMSEARNLGAELRKTPGQLQNWGRLGEIRSSGRDRDAVPLARRSQYDGPVRGPGRGRDGHGA